MSLVRVERLHYRYPPFDPNDPDPDMTWALEDISLDVEPGEFFGITGTTGSGKSTLCMALTGLVPQQTSGTIRGDVWIGDINTKRHPVVEIATRVGIVFQDPEANFLGLTVEDEVAFGAENLGVDRNEIDERIRWALDLVGMGSSRMAGVSRLSGGQKQRVAIASALAMLPEVLILDDPTAELDPVGTTDVLRVVQAVRERRPEIAVIMTSGDPEPLVDGADSVIVLDAGKVIATGTPSQVYRHAGHLMKRGVPIPAVSDLAVVLSRETGMTFDFHTVDMAVDTLSEALPK